jgi:predicted SAM-dependent methyltransferase
MKIIIGAGGRTQDGWISTEQGQLDVLKEEDFAHVLKGAVGFENMVAEHVFEHIPMSEIPAALSNCYKYLSLGGRIRIAVPDGLHSDNSYIEYVRPGGTGAGAEDHKVLYSYRLLSRLMREAGFTVEYLEWWDETGKFHTRLWNEKDGYIDRCLANDSRNNDGKPNYTSLILDGVKMNDEMRPNLEKAFAFIEENDIHKLSPFNRKKTTGFYELARLAPAGGAIVEIGSYLGMGTAALWYGALDGNKGKVYAVDPYIEMTGWAGEPYGPSDLEIWNKNMKWADIHPILVRGFSKEVSDIWKEPVSLAMFDIPFRGQMPKDVPDWERHVIVGGLIGLRDIDDYSMGTGKAIENLMCTGRWGNVRNLEAFITSIERIT